MAAKGLPPGFANVASLNGVPFMDRIRSPSGRGRLDGTVEQLDRHALRGADEADAHARPNRRRLAGELDALGLEIGGDRIDAAHGKPEMIETAVGRGRGSVDAVAGR